MRRQDGYTLVPALLVLVFVATISAGVLGLALRRQSTSRGDRYLLQATQAADAGADVAGWRMNRALVSAGGAGVLGFVTDTVRQVGCISVTAGSFSVAQGTNAWCNATPWTTVGDGAEFSYKMSLDVNAVGSGLNDVIIRRVVVTGRAGNRERRILVVYRLDIDPAKTTTLFRRWHDVTCTSKPTGPAIDSGCPSVGL